jgi:hypothetical protein
MVEGIILVGPLLQPDPNVATPVKVYMDCKKFNFIFLMLIFLTQVFLAQIASRVLPSFALGKIFVDDVTSDKVKEFIKGQ